MLDLCRDASRILYFWYVLESIHRFIIELHVPQCLFVKGSNEKKDKVQVGLFHILQKERLLHLLWQPSVLGVILQSGFHSCTLQFGQEQNIPEHSIESRAYLFFKKIARMFLILTCRNRKMNPFIIVTIIPTCKRQFIG